jgi:hypothetical protein
MAKKSTEKSTETTEKKKKEYKLDLFGQTLPALYKCDFDFYARCTEDERKEISPLILMRWVSLAEGYQSVAPELVNSFINEGFWQLSKHPELQWKQLCMVASEISTRTPRHKWMMPKKKKSSTPLLDDYLIRMHPMLSDMEIDIIKQKFEGEEDIKELVRQFGGTDKEIKDAVKEYRDIYGSKSA